MVIGVEGGEQPLLLAKLVNMQQAVRTYPENFATANTDVNRPSAKSSEEGKTM